MWFYLFTTPARSASDRSEAQLERGVEDHTVDIRAGHCDLCALEERHGRQLSRDQVLDLLDESGALIEQIQDMVAAQLSTVPLLQGAQVAVAGADVDGVILDASFKLRFAPITR